jgi:peptide/nickel transport system permease protein
MAIAVERQSVDTTGVESRTLERSASRLSGWSISGWLGIAIILVMVVTALIGPSVLPADPEKQQLAERLQPPIGFGGVWEHPLGTDQLGRDIASRVISAARLSLVIGVVSTLATAAIGVVLGLAGGYLGGRIDRFVVFLLDVALALPFLVIAVAVTAAIGGGMQTLFITLIATGWIGYARILRLQARALRRAEFIDAAHALGASRTRLLVRHLLPNVAGTVIVLATQQVAGMMLYAAALSYLGLGLNPDQITWGGMVAAGQELLIVAWWPAVMPGLTLVLTVVGFSLAGDAIRDRIERPHLHRNR